MVLRVSCSSLNFSSHRRTDKNSPPICHSSTLQASQIDHLLLYSPPNDFISTLPELYRHSNIASKQRFVSSRTRSLRKSLRKIMSRFAQNSLPMCSPTASAAQAYVAEEYVYMDPAELPGDREPCELPADAISLGSDQQMCRHEGAEPYATPVEAVAWQRHLPLDQATGDLTNVGRMRNTSHISSHPLAPIDTFVDMARTSPVHMNAHYVSPNMDHHDYRATDIASTTLLRPPTTLSPSFETYPSISISPPSSIISGTTNYCIAKPATHGMQTANGPLQHNSGLQNSQYSMDSHDQYSYNHFMFHDNVMIADHAPLATAATRLHHRFSHNPEVSEQSPWLSNAQRNLSAYHGVQYGISDPNSEISPFAQRRLFASEQYIDGLSSHVPFDSYYDGPQSQRTTYNKSFYLDEALPAYEASSVPLRVEEQTARQSQATPRPYYRQSKVKRTAVTAARAIVNILPLSCIHCGELFTGKYQKANCLRHINLFHVDVDLSAAGIDDGKTCRTCLQHFRRPDARRKHEWKQHKTEDCRPHKRRIEKRGGEKRIYMPPMPDDGGNS
ncbi:uncharacterized protein CC84DRAFT_157654 [Paraphaeosphaeria sporulosa]|uniref:C2H2-type domain-containing protein n=1 Tax=Paraphaeosphaeria sporulosa TaxID=1460663 RepID=A0A177D0H1_9PLEO|nr:uncharacterized protein CC84DRAFT_157654 [Paraphaeosphaeria sporulosa]OAG12727.1 hypothetical protein CC84DRAFT_157654 [Paraphaeosphaeria sporulosa]